jgi:hypothetical protein
MNTRHDRRLVLCEHFVIRQFLCDATDIDGNAASNQKCQNRTNSEEISDKPYHKSGILPSDHSHIFRGNQNEHPSTYAALATSWFSDHQMRQRQDRFYVFTNLTHANAGQRQKSKKLLQPCILSAGMNMSPH